MSWLERIFGRSNEVDLFDMHWYSVMASDAKTKKDREIAEEYRQKFCPHLPPIKPRVRGRK